MQKKIQNIITSVQQIIYEFLFDSNETRCCCCCCCCCCAVMAPLKLPISGKNNLRSASLHFCKKKHFAITIVQKKFANVSVFKRCKHGLALRILPRSQTQLTGIPSQWCDWEERLRQRDNGDGLSFKWNQQKKIMPLQNFELDSKQLYIVLHFLLQASLSVLEIRVNFSWLCLNSKVSKDTLNTRRRVL